MVGRLPNGNPKKVATHSNVHTTLFRHSLNRSGWCARATSTIEESMVIAAGQTMRTGLEYMTPSRNRLRDHVEALKYIYEHVEKWAGCDRWQSTVTIVPLHRRIGSYRPLSQLHSASPENGSVPIGTVGSLDLLGRNDQHPSYVHTISASGQVTPGPLHLPTSLG